MTMLHSGERQVSESLDGIRADHTERYKFASKLLSGTVYDLGCGIGYGSRILADAGCDVIAIDRSLSSIEYGKKHYGCDRITWYGNDISKVSGSLPAADAAVAFEVVEHINDPRPLLKAMAKSSKRLIASVPNEEKYPWHDNIAYHYRHYTKKEFNDLLAECGWVVTEWWGQAGPESPVKRDVKGRTLIAVCDRSAAPEHVVIVGLGPSDAQYLDFVKRLGGRHKFCDQTWVINAHGNVLDCDLIFHMDDVRIQEIRAAERPESNIAAMLEWMKTTKTPIMTSRAHPDYPSLVEFPLEDVINTVTFDYFNNTSVYALVYAIYLGVKKVTIFGCDFTYPNAHDSEKGRGCLEFWLGYAAAKGVKIGLPQTTTLMDACYPRQHRLYGYDTRKVTFVDKEDGTLGVEFEEVEELPTADEIEDRYDHSKHPNVLVEN